MGRLAELIAVFSADEAGATAIEYGLMAALIAVAAIAAFSTLSGGLDNLFGTSVDGAGTRIEAAAGAVAP